MADFYADDRARESRLAAIRARRGTAEREALINEIAAAKEKAAVAKKKSAGPSIKKTRENSDQYHGHSWDEWDQMRDIGLDLIKERAAKREFTTYTQIWDAAVAKLGKPLGNSYFQLPSLLEHITQKGFDDGELVVSALVIDSSDNPAPGAGFFGLAAEKRLIDASEAPKSNKNFVMNDTQRAFWQQQVDALFAKYGA